MDGGALNRLNQLRTFTAVLEKGDAPTLASRLADMAECLARQQLLLEPHQGPASASAAGPVASPAVGAASGLSAQLAAAQQQQQHGTSQIAAAVTAWAASVLKLFSRPETQATGALLLGATAACCTLGRLACSFAAWGTTLSELLRKEQAQGRQRQDVQRACLIALAQILTRLQEVAHVEGVRRDGSPLTSRAVAAALSLLGAAPSNTSSKQQQGQQGQQGVKASASQASEALALPAVEVIFAALSTLPASLRQQTTLLETTLAALSTGRISVRGSSTPAPGTAGVAGPAGAAAAVGGGTASACSGAVRQGAARCLALLPRVPGTAEAWSGMARRALVSLADATDAAFMGLGDDTLASRAREQLGTGGDGVLGALPTIHTSVAEGGALKQLRPALDTLAAALSLVEQILTAPFPVPVPLPGQAVLFAVHRLLRLDEGAVLAAGRVPPSSSMFAELCAAMPAVREAAWQLLAKLLSVGGPSLCPHHAAAGVAVLEGLRRQRARGPAALAATPPSERVAMYRCAAALVLRGGVATGRQLAGEALSAASVEFFGAGAAPEDPTTNASGVQGTGLGGWQGQGQRPSKRQKQGGGAGAGAGQGTEAEPAAAAAAAGAPDGGSPEELGAAAEAAAMLTAILQVVGGLLPAATRAKYDALACHMASCASDAATAASREPRCSGLQAAAVKVLQQAVLETLLASVLAPCRHRPPYLGQALRLFKQGRSDSCPAVVSFCTAALLSCEGLLHPRSLPMAGTQQYAGLQEVAPLVKPRMWSVLDPVVAKPQPTMLAPSEPNTAPQPSPAPAAAPAPAPTPTSAPAPVSAAASAQPVIGGGATGVAVGAKRPLQPLLPLKQQQQQQRQQEAAAEAAAQAQATKPSAAAAIATAAPTPAAASVTDATAVAPAAPAPPAVAAPSAFADAEESSDSEGSLPDIDSGGDDEDDA